MLHKAPSVKWTKTRLAMNRRDLLIGSLSFGGALAVGFPPATGADANNAGQPLESSFDLDAYVVVGSDDVVTIHSTQFDMGQGVYHGIATLVLEELGARWDQIKVVGASGAPEHYGNAAWPGFGQWTGGSTSMASSWMRYRIAGAAARSMLVEAAALRWGVSASEIEVSEGTVHHGTDRLTFGALAQEAAAIPVPKEIALKPASEWTLIGKDAVRRFDTRQKANGQHQFTIDVKLPDMATAVMIHPPRFGATLRQYDATEALKLTDVLAVVPTRRGLAVVGKHMWASLQARDAVKVEWDETGAEMRGSDDIVSEYRRVASKPAAIPVREEGAVDQAFASAVRVFEAEYVLPYLAHAAIEPLNAVACIREDGHVDIWGGHQFPDHYQKVAADVAKVPVDKVRLHVVKAGGSFGRRAVGDADADLIVEAVEIAKALGQNRPVKVQWTRDNDIKGGRYRPIFVHRLRAGVDAAGKIVAWDQHIVGQSIMKGTVFEPSVVKGVDYLSVEGAVDHPYAFANQRIGLTSMEVGVPVLWWRSVGHSHTAFAIETFVDEISAALGHDPIDYRLNVLGMKPRLGNTLRLAAEAAGWGKPLAAGRFHGVASAESFGSFVSNVVEASVEDGQPVVHKIVCAVDCGVPINPDNIRSQIAGGATFGLSAALAEEITLDQGRVVQEGFGDYTLLRIDQAPEIEVHIVPSSEKPTGVGEPGVSSIAPAVANAISAATRKRIRRLPIMRELSA